MHLLNAHGLDEAGIDGGGIFREFLNELLKSGFNPNQGFFKTTNEGLLYPSPAAHMLVGDSFARHYYFLGRMLGKVRCSGTTGCWGCVSVWLPSISLKIFIQNCLSNFGDPCIVFLCIITNLSSLRVTCAVVTSIKHLHSMGNLGARTIKSCWSKSFQGLLAVWLCARNTRKLSVALIASVTSGFCSYKWSLKVP